MPTITKETISEKSNIIICLVFGCITWLLYVIGFATTSWLRVESFGGTAHTGLWKICSTTSSTSVCLDLKDTYEDDGFLKGAQACMSLAFVCIFVAVIMNILILINVGANTARTMAILLLAFGSLFVYIGVILFVVEFIDDVEHLHWSFGLTIVAAIFADIYAGLIRSLIPGPAAVDAATTPVVTVVGAPQPGAVAYPQPVVYAQPGAEGYAQPQPVMYAQPQPSTVGYAQSPPPGYVPPQPQPENTQINPQPEATQVNP